MPFLQLENQYWAYMWTVLAGLLITLCVVLIPDCHQASLTKEQHRQELRLRAVDNCRLTPEEALRVWPTE